MLNARTTRQMPLLRNLMSISALAVVLVLATACVTAPPRMGMGMVKDPKTGLMFGSTIERSLVTDASFYNNKIKVRTRNTSGDTAFGLSQFTNSLRNAYRSNGFNPTTGNDFGLLMDVNVLYSGQIQQDMSVEYGFLGAAAGGIAGARSSANHGTAIGVVAGATLGGILGSFVTDDTYIIVTQVTFGVVKKSKKSKKRITFSRSTKIKNVDDPDEEEKVYNHGFKKAYSTRVAVYAGGRNVTQAEIARQVRERIIRIVSEFI